MLLDALTVIAGAENAPLATSLLRWAESGTGPQEGQALPLLLSYGFLQGGTAQDALFDTFAEVGLEARFNDSSATLAEALLSASDGEALRITALPLNATLLTLVSLDDSGTAAAAAATAPLLATFEDALEDLVLTTVVDGEQDRALLTRAAAAAERFGRLLSVLPPERLAAPENGPLLTLALNASSAGGNLLADRSSPAFSMAPSLTSSRPATRKPWSVESGTSTGTGSASSPITASFSQKARARAPTLSSSATAEAFPFCSCKTSQASWLGKATSTAASPGMGRKW